MFYHQMLLKLIDSLFHHLQSTLYVLLSEAVISSGEAAVEREKNPLDAAVTGFTSIL